MNEYEKKCENIHKAINFVKGFCVICSKPKRLCDNNCEYGTILQALALQEKLEGAQHEDKTT